MFVVTEGRDSTYYISLFNSMYVFVAAAAIVIEH